MRAGGELARHRLERVVERRHEEQAHDVDDEDARAVPRRVDIGAASGRAGRIVDRAQEAVVAVGEGERLALVPDVVAGGDAIGAGRDQLLQNILGDAEAAGGVLAVHDDEVEAMLLRSAAAARASTAARPERPTTSPRKSSLTRRPPSRISSRSVAISGRRTSCGSSGTASTSWQAKAMPARRNVFAARDEVRDRAVVVAGAVADAPAAPVEGGKRRDDEVRIDHRLAGVRVARAEHARLEARLAVEAAKEHASLLDDRHGDTARRPCSTSSISPRGSISSRIGQNSDTVSPGAKQRPQVRHGAARRPRRRSSSVMRRPARQVRARGAPPC